MIIHQKTSGRVGRGVSYDLLTNDRTTPCINAFLVFCLLTSGGLIIVHFYSPAGELVVTCTLLNAFANDSNDVSSKSLPHSSRLAGDPGTFCKRSSAPEVSLSSAFCRRHHQQHVVQQPHTPPVNNMQNHTCIPLTPGGCAINHCLGAGLDWCYATATNRMNYTAKIIYC